MSDPADYTLAEAAELLGLNYYSLRRRVARGEVHARQVRNKWGRMEYRIRAEDVRLLRGGAGRTPLPPPPSPAEEDLAARFIARLEEENRFLREQIQAKDRQIEAGARLAERLSRQAEVLLALAQGVDVKSLLARPPAPPEEPGPADTTGEKAAAAAASWYETAARVPAPGAAQAPPEEPAPEPQAEAAPEPQAAPEPEAAPGPDPEAERLAALVRELAARGLTPAQTATLFNRTGLTPPDGAAEWTAQAVSAAVPET